jgi:uncharacterized protein YjbI with pentapeptide repeats
MVWRPGCRTAAWIGWRPGRHGWSEQPGFSVYLTAGRISTPDLPAGRIARHNGANQFQVAAMTERERPANWEDWKWLHRWPRLSSVEWALEWLVYWCKGLAFFEVLEFVGRASVLVVIFLWFWEAGDREKQKHYRAWDLINSARGSTSDGGRREALQDLNEDHIDMTAAPLAKAYLRYVQLPKAILNEANLTKADLTGANLTGTELIEAKLTETKLIGTDLAGADLTNAKLTKLDQISRTKLPLPLSNITITNLGSYRYIRSTNLTGADLTWANLTNADLVEADLTNAKLALANLTGANLTGANVTGADLAEADLTNAKLVLANLSKGNWREARFCQTTMPDGTVNNRDCPPEPTPPDPSKTPPAPN